METETGKGRVAEAERRRKERGGRKTEEKAEERKDDRGKESNRRVGDLG